MTNQLNCKVSHCPFVSKKGRSEERMLTMQGSYAGEEDCLSALPDGVGVDRTHF